MISRNILVVVLMPLWFLCPGEYGSSNIHVTFIISLIYYHTYFTLTRGAPRCTTTTIDVPPRRLSFSREVCRRWAKIDAHPCPHAVAPPLPRRALSTPLYQRWHPPRRIAPAIIASLCLACHHCRSLLTPTPTLTPSPSGPSPERRACSPSISPPPNSRGGDHKITKNIILPF